MNPFIPNAPVLTDRDGWFAVAPRVLVRSYLTNPRLPKLEALFFSDPGFHRIAYRLVDPTRANEPIGVTLRPRGEFACPSRGTPLPRAQIHHFTRKSSWRTPACPKTRSE